MILNSKQAAHFVVESEFSARAQCGIDLSLKKVNFIKPISNNPLDIGLILKDKTVIRPESYSTVEISEITYEGKIYKGWHLVPGVYDFQFNEKLKLDEHHSAILLQRSSLPRTSGTTSAKSFFDPGFSTEENTIGSTYIVAESVFIEENARVGQLIIFENHESEKYSGQYFGEKQKNHLGK